MRRRVRIAWLAAAMLLFVVLGHDGRHHWHEWRYLYSAAYVPVESMMSGEFDPGPPPDRDPAEVGAWYWGQALHEVLLVGQLALLGDEGGVATPLLWASGAMVLAAALLWIPILRRLPIESGAAGTVAILLVTPLMCWVGFKLMAEAPALLFASLAGLAGVQALDAQQPWRRWAWAVAGGVAAGSCFLTMVYIPLLVWSFIFARIAILGDPARRGAEWTTAGIMGVAFVVSAVAGMTALGIGPGNYAEMYGFYRGYEKSWLVNAFGIVTAGSALWAVLPVAARHPARRDLRFFAVWAVAALAPILIFSSNYIESRFLLVAAVPFAGLLSLAAHCIATRLPENPPLPISLAVPVTAFVTWATLFVLPYEMNSRELRQVIAHATADDDDAVLLIPWNYTDYHFLRVDTPNREVLLVQAPIDAEGSPIEDEAWTARRRSTYGRRFVASPEEVAAYRERPLYYVGHGRMPPFNNLAGVADAIGLTFISDRIAALNPLEHVTHSWMWQHPDFRFEQVFDGGHYRAYRVHWRRDSK